MIRFRVEGCGRSRTTVLGGIVIMVTGHNIMTKRMVLFQSVRFDLIL